MRIAPILTEGTITPHILFEHKNTTCDVGNPGPGLGQAQKTIGFLNRLITPIDYSPCSGCKNGRGNDCLKGMCVVNP